MQKAFVLILLLMGLIYFGVHVSTTEELPASSLPKTGELDISVQFFANGLNKPVGLVNAGDDRLFAIERTGRTQIIRPDGTVENIPFLDISDRVHSEWGHTGLLGIAFHPEFATNGYFYLQYSHLITDTHITRLSRFSVTDDPDRADPDSEKILLTIEQPWWDHNGGGIYFSPIDGYLYFLVGDGGSSGDPHPNLNSQNMSKLLGKVVRIDVNGGGTVVADCAGMGTGDYTIPNDNPFIDGVGNSCDEIWALGLRSPWQGSFDQQLGDFYIADVGEYNFEEIDFQPVGMGGLNYGWRCYEGDSPFIMAGCDPAGNYTFPIHVTNHSDGNCSIIGGYVYRGTNNPGIFGHYLATDFCTGDFWDITPNGSGGWTVHQYNDIGPIGQGVAFGEDSAGELYLVSFAGNLLKVKENSVTPIAGLHLAENNQMKFALADSQISFTHLLSNTGNIRDTFVLAGISEQGWQISTSPNPNLNAGTSAQIAITVTVPVSTASGTVDTIAFTANSHFEGIAFATVIDQIEILDVNSQLWLPIVAKRN